MSKSCAFKDLVMPFSPLGGKFPESRARRPRCSASRCLPGEVGKEYIKQRRESHAPPVLPAHLVRHDPAGGGRDGSTRPGRPQGPAAEAVRDARPRGCGGGVGPVYG